MTYKVQIDDTVTNATRQDSERIDAIRAEAESRATVAEQIAAARASARAKLAALGLTEAEVAALVG